MKNKLPVSGRYWKRRIKSSMGNNVIRPFVEIITNSVDSYRRIGKDNEGVVIIKYDHDVKSYVQDFAEGIPKEKFDKIISYGEKTSGVHSGKKVRGFFGIGLKDACLALKEAKISSVKDRKRNTCYIGMAEDGTPEYEFLEEDKPTLSKDETRISFKVPKNFTKLDKRKSYCFLANNYMLRRINKDERYKIFLIEEEPSSEKELLRHRIVYRDPKIEEKLLEKEIKMNYPKIGEIKIKITINKAERELSQHGDAREGGLIIFFNETAVLDCTLAGYDNHTYARNFFGEVELEGFEKFLEKDEAVLSDERKGLDKTHSFVEKLFNLLNKEIGELVKNEERKSQKDDIKKVSSLNINRALGMINKIAQEEMGKGDVTTPPKEFLPEKFGFYFPYVDIFDYEKKTLVLKINCENIGEDIRIESTNENISVSPDKIKITKKEGFQTEKLQIFAQKSNIQGDIIAKTNYHSTKILTNVLPNPKIKEDLDFYFHPDDTFIIKGKKKDFLIIIKKELLKKGKIFLSSNSKKLEYQKEVELNKKNMAEINENYCEVKIPIISNVSEEDIRLKAEYKKLKAELLIREVVDPSEHNPRGFFKDIKEDKNRDPMELTSYEKGIIYIHTLNPVLSFFQKVVTGRKDYENFFYWRSIVAKIAVERICREIILEKDKRNNLPILNLDDSAKPDYINYKIKEFYFKYGKKFIDVLLKRESRMDFIESESEN